MIAIPLGVLLGLFVALALTLSLARISEAWAEFALQSLIATAQGGPSSSLIEPRAGCPAPGSIVPGAFSILDRDGFFGAWEFVVLLPDNKKKHFSLRRHGREWSCDVSLLAN
jgi:hypothetical protein